MSTPFLGEIKIVSFGFAPRGWALCNGQLLPINQNQPLFSLFGTTYGGDGRVNFALPDMQGRTPFHQGAGFTMGQRAGSTAVTLNITQLPSHTHAGQGVSSTPNINNPAGHLWCQQASNAYSTAAPNAAMATTGITPTGGSLPHPNLSPYLVLTMIVALQGIFPSQT